MENYIENIELINRYLNKTLCESDIQAFENRLKVDSNFSTLFEEHQLFLEGLKRQQLKTDIIRAKQTYVRNKWFKVFGIILSGLIVLFAVAYFNLFNSDKEYLKGKLNFESEFVQNFNVPIDSFIEIVGQNGTVIKFNPKNLETRFGKPITGDSLKVELIELTTKQDLLLANAQTTSNGKRLISGGAFKIDIIANGEPLVLKESKTIDAQFPKNTSEADMQIFYGDRDNEGNINWIESNIKFKQNPFVVFINEGFVIDSVLSKQFGVVFFKGVSVIDTLGFMNFTDLKKKFPKINLYDKDADTIRVLKKYVQIIDDYYDGELDDLENPFRVESIDELYNKKDVIIDSTLIDLEEYRTSELREIMGKLCKQITKQELNELEEVISKEEYKKRRLKYDNYIEEIQVFNEVSNELYKTIELSKLGWINIDKFAAEEETAKIKLNFNINTSYNEIYIVDQKNNTILNVYNDEVDLPINRSFYIIVLGIKGKDIYGFKKSFRFNKNSECNIAYKKINEKQLKSFLIIE